MTTNVGNVTVRNLNKQVDMTVTVVLSRRFSYRLTLGLWLMKLGALITPFGVSVVTK